MKKRRARIPAFTWIQSAQMIGPCSPSLGNLVALLPAAATHNSLVRPRAIPSTHLLNETDCGTFELLVRPGEEPGHVGSPVPPRRSRLVGWCRPRR